MSAPTSDHVALAIVTACRLTGEDPMAVASGEYGLRARHVALAALLAAFPDACKVKLGQCCGYQSRHSGASNLSSCRRSLWWREEWVDEVVGAVVADQYGEQAR